MKNFKSLALFFGLVLMVLMGQSSCPFVTSPPENMEDENMMDEDDGMVNEDDMMNDNGMMDDEADTSMETEGMMVEGTPEDELDDDMIEGTGENEDTEVDAEAEAGVYTAYDPALVGSNENVVLFFHAPWCPDCRAADADILANAAAIPENLTILKVDYDSNTELRTQHGVTYQHTFVEVDADGNKVNLWSGGNLETIIDNAV